MAIENMYNQTAVTQREGAVGASTIKKAYQAHLSSFKCHVQPLEAEVVQDLPGGFGKNWLMFCPCLDIKEGDKVIVDGTTEYRVMGVENYDFSNNPHLEVTIRAFK